MIDAMIGFLGLVSLAVTIYEFLKPETVSGAKNRNR